MVLPEAQKVKATMQWIPQKIGDANVGCLPMKSSSSEQSYPKGEDMRHTTCNTIEASLSMTLGVYIFALDAGYGTTEFTICPVGFSSCFDSAGFCLLFFFFFFFWACSSLLEWKHILCVIWYVASIYFSLWFLWRLTAKSLPWVSKASGFSTML